MRVGGIIRADESRGGHHHGEWQAGHRPPAPLLLRSRVASGPRSAHVPRPAAPARGEARAPPWSCMEQTAPQGCSCPQLRRFGSAAVDQTPSSSRRHARAPSPVARCTPRSGFCVIAASVLLQHTGTAACAAIASAAAIVSAGLHEAHAVANRLQVN